MSHHLNISGISSSVHHINKRVCLDFLAVCMEYFAAQENREGPCGFSVVGFQAVDLQLHIIYLFVYGDSVVTKLGATANSQRCQGISSPQLS